jgi:streptogramin lyase
MSSPFGWSWLNHLVRSWKPPRRRQPLRPRRDGRPCSRPWLEALEDRLAPASLGRSSVVEGPAAGSDAVILADTGSWTAVSNATFLHVTTGSASGSGNALVQFSFDANGGATRSGTLSIAGLTFTVTQAGSGYTAASPLTTLVPSGLSIPYDVAVDGSGNVFIADTNHNAIKEYNAATQQVSTLVSSGLSDPYGVAVDGAGNVFIADTGNNAIKEWSPTTGVRTLVSGLDFPAGVAVDSSGNVYFSDGNNKAIKEYNTTTGTVSTLVSSGLSSPRGVAVDAAGNVYIADLGDQAVKEWSATTGTVTTLVAGYLTFPFGVAVDGSGNVYVADSSHDAIKEWNPTTGTLSTLVDGGLYYPQGVAVDGAGNVFIADTNNGAIKELTRAFVPGGPIREGAEAGSDVLPVLPTSESLSGLFAPSSDQPWLTLGAATDGVIPFSFSANPGTKARTAHVTVLGQQITVTQGPFLARRSVVEGPGLGFDSVELIISGPWTATSNAPFLHIEPGDSSGSGNSVVIFTFDANDGPTRSGTLTIAGDTFTVTQAGTGYFLYLPADPLTTLIPSGLSSPGGLAVDGAGNVFIADTGSSLLREWNATIGTLSTLVSSGLNDPQGVAVDGAGNVFIADTGDNAIKEYNASTGQVNTLVSAGLSSPQGVALDSAGNVYIADTGDNALKEYNASTGQVSTLLTGLGIPVGVAVDAADNIYIAELGKGEILEWTPGKSQFVSMPSGVLGSGPQGLAVDVAGNVYFVDTGNNAIKEWNAATGLRTLVTSDLSGHGGLAVDAAGNIYFSQSKYSLVTLSRVLIPSGPVSVAPRAGSDALLPVLPTSQSLSGSFAPSSDQPWLTLGTPADGVIPFSFTANTSPPRTAHITVFGQQITVTQDTLLASGISFPADGGIYNAAGWSGSIRGTAVDHSGSGLKQVQVSIRQAGSGLYWDGSAFASATEQFFTAAGTASWSLSFAVDNFAADGAYVVHSRAIDNDNDVESSGSTATFVIDRAAPTVMISAPSESSTAGGPVTYSVTFSDADFASSTLSAANVHLLRTGSADGTLSFDNGTGSTRTVTISGITGNGTLSISIDAGSAVDQAGNVAPAAGPSAAFTVNNTAPQGGSGGSTAPRTANPGTSADSAFLVGVAVAPAVSSSAPAATVSGPPAVVQQSTTASFPGGSSPSEIRTQPGGGNQEDTVAPSLEAPETDASRVHLPGGADGFWVQDADDPALASRSAALEEAHSMEQASDRLLSEGGAPYLGASVGVGTRAEESGASIADASVADALFSEAASGLATGGQEWAHIATLAALALAFANDSSAEEVLPARCSAPLRRSRMVFDRLRTAG